VRGNGKKVRENGKKREWRGELAMKEGHMGPRKRPKHASNANSHLNLDVSTLSIKESVCFQYEREEKREGLVKNSVWDTLPSGRGWVKVRRRSEMRGHTL
jgi:hypothetical protein